MAFPWRLLKDGPQGLTWQPITFSTWRTREAISYLWLCGPRRVAPTPGVTELSIHDSQVPAEGLFSCQVLHTRFLWLASRMTAGDGRLRANRFSCLSESIFCHSAAWLRLYNCSKWRMEALALPSENFFSVLSGPLISSNSILNLCRFFFWVDVKFFFFFLSLGCWVGCFIIIFLILVKAKKFFSEPVLK